MKCEVCGTTEHLMVCSRCHSVAYCSAEHQKEDWKKHKAVCVARPREGAGEEAVGTASDGTLVGAREVDECFAAWHDKTVEYWGADKSSVSGMLGGLPQVDGVDLSESRAVVDMLVRGALVLPRPRGRRGRGRSGAADGDDAALRAAQYVCSAAGGRVPAMRCGRVLDCGAGIGRVTRGVFADRFARLDLVEQNAQYLETARAQTLAPWAAKVGAVVAAPLQACDPAALVGDGAPYDLIWVQWVVLYMSDAELVAFLQRARAALVRDGRGYIVVKDNVTRGPRFWVDRDDGSLVRSDAQLRAVFRRAGMTLLLARLQPDFPPDLFPIMTDVLQ